LDRVIQRNASASEEMASTSSELASQAEQLRETIAFFRIGDTDERSVTSMKKTAGAIQKEADRRVGEKSGDGSKNDAADRSKTMHDRFDRHETGIGENREDWKDIDTDFERY
ncbi:hypothetical protein QUF72_03935, partial [Desulfobacterales bacterium HSG2]|nr:hypothetical protein [Desulfobacterales bacterium HSG2]